MPAGDSTHRISSLRVLRVAPLRPARPLQRHMDL